MDAHVIAYPVDGAWVIECAVHGFLTIATDHDVDHTLATHMTTSHGARVPA